MGMFNLQFSLGNIYLPYPKGGCSSVG